MKSKAYLFGYNQGYMHKEAGAGATKVVGNILDKGSNVFDMYNKAHSAIANSNVIDISQGIADYGSSFGEGASNVFQHRDKLKHLKRLKDINQLKNLKNLRNLPQAGRNLLNFLKGTGGGGSSTGGFLGTGVSRYLGPVALTAHGLEVAQNMFVDPNTGEINTNIGKNIKTRADMTTKDVVENSKTPTGVLRNAWNGFSSPVTHTFAAGSVTNDTLNAMEQSLDTQNAMIAQRTARDQAAGGTPQELARVKRETEKWDKMMAAKRQKKLDAYNKKYAKQIAAWQPYHERMGGTGPVTIQQIREYNRKLVDQKRNQMVANN
jgi:hypothetical protein